MKCREGRAEDKYEKGDEVFVLSLRKQSVFFDLLITEESQPTILALGALFYLAFNGALRRVGRTQIF